MCEPALTGRGPPRRGRGRGGGKSHHHKPSSNSAEGTTRDRGGGGAERHPPHLRGKEIGLWYAMRGPRKTIENYPKIQLDEATSEHIVQLLKTLDERSSDDVEAGQESDFLKRYKQNLDDNALANQASNYITSDELELQRSPHLDETLKSELARKQESHKYREMIMFREKLPAFQHKDNFLKLIFENQVVVISGETGCGKTTQCCQLILDKMISEGNGSLCNIVCTQPRRISAISVSERVAEERDERVGGKSVGYSIRLETILPKNDRGTILFCTTGVVFQYLKKDPRLSRFSHVVVDEIHERDVLSDFLIAILKDLIKIRKDLKVVLMSATINAGHFSKYFGNCPVYNIPGFTYPVKEYYLEDVLERTRFVFECKQNSYSRGPPRGRKQDNDAEYHRLLESHLRQIARENSYSRHVVNELKKPEADELNLDLVEALLLYICDTDKDNGAVLVFVPGWDQISKLNSTLQESGKFPESKYLIIPLHSLMPTVNQRDVFNRPRPGVRKIIIATNIAETSITIDDIVFVINTGKIKITNFDLSKNLESLDTEWVSLANATQRKGRAGRVQEGVCFHLYNQARQLALETFKKPEILRKRLEEVILQIKVLKLGAAGPFFRRLLDSPSERSVQLAIERLIKIAALDKEENLTPLGFHLAQLPMDPQTGKMILMGGIFGCLDPILTVASSLSFKDGFYIPLGHEKYVDQVRKDLSRDTKSDHMVTVYAMEGYEEARRLRRERDFCYRNYLSANTLQMLMNMKTQFAEHLHQMKFISSSNYKDESHNINSRNLALIKAVICAGLYPNIAKVIIKKRRDGTSSFPKISTLEDGKVELHPKSVNSDERNYESPFLAYFQKMKSSSVFLYDTTMVSPLPMIFFGGELRFRVEKRYGILSVDQTVDFQIDKSLFEQIQALRRHLDNLLEEKIRNPGPTCWNKDSTEGVLLRAISELITSEYGELIGGNYDVDGDDDY